jgi:hypothetical protein
MIARPEKKLWTVWDAAKEPLEEVKDPMAANLTAATMETLEEVEDLMTVNLTAANLKAVHLVLQATCGARSGGGPSPRKSW